MLPRTPSRWLSLVIAAGCGGDRPEPDRVVVDHILIGVRSAKMPTGRRNSEEARDVAYDLLSRLLSGADWADLKREYSEDPPPGGPYALRNRGVAPASGQEYARDGMVRAFGDVGFSLEPGETAIADFSPQSPYGFHIIRRLE